MFHICLVGFGRWGKVYFDTINTADYCLVDCIVSRSALDFGIGEKNIPVFSDVEEAIRSRKIDGFIIATPPETHFDLASICLEKGYPVLVEKPFTANYAEAIQINQIAKKTNIFCMAGYQHLFSINYMALKAEAVKKRINFNIYAESLGHGPFRENVSVFRDWGSHEFARAIDFFDEIPHAHSIERISGDSGDLYRAVYFLTLEFTQGRYQCVFGNVARVKRRTLIATMKSDWVFYDELDQGGYAFMRDGKIFNPKSVLTTHMRPVSLMLAEFVRNATARIYMSKSLDATIEVVRLIDKIESCLT